MKKGTKLVALLLGLALLVPACDQKETSSTPSEAPTSSDVSSNDPSASSEAPVNYTVTISNKTALQADWFVGDAARKVEINVEPKANVTQLVNEGKIQITSSDASKVSIVGQMANPVADGQVTITVKCGESQDTVAITLQPKQTTKTKYGVDHDGTLEDPFTNEDAIKVAKSDKYNKEDFYVRGEIASFYHAPGSRTDGAVSWFLKPAQAGGEQFEVYKCYKENGTGAEKYLTDDDIWAGGVATAHGKFTYYNNTQAETDGAAVFVNCEGNKPQPRQVLEKTFAEALSAGAALADGDQTWDYYKFEGYVSAKEGNAFFLTATKGEALVKGTSDASHGEREYYTNAIELYFSAAPAKEIADILLDGAKVEVKMIIKNYHGTIENGPALAAEDIVLKEAGTQWAVPEPTVEPKTVTEFVALDYNTIKKTKAYTVTATIKNFKNAATKDEYGNMTITDGTTDLIIYGASATATALAWDNSSQYAFSNPKDFLTNTTTQALAVGNTITMKLIRADYTDKNTGDVTIEGSGVITNVVAVATATIALNKATDEVQVGKTITLTATRTPENSNTPCEWISSDNTVATVAGGVVTGVAKGTATITAKISDEIKAECVVTVNEAETVDVKWTSAEFFGYDGSADVGYGSVTEKTLNGITLGFTDMAAFKNQGGDIQFKKTSGYLEFKTATTKRIAKLILEKSGSKNYTCKTYAASTVAGLASASAATGNNEVYTFDATADIHAIKIGGGTGASYLKSISIVYAD